MANGDDRDERDEREDERDERDERRELRRKNPTDELIEDELKALEDVLEAIEHLNTAAQQRVLRAATDLLPPPLPVTPR